MANQQLVDYLKSALEKGSNKIDLEKSLKAQGWPDSEINAAFGVLLNKPVESPKPIAAVVEEKKMEGPKAEPVEAQTPDTKPASTATPINPVATAPQTPPKGSPVPVLALILGIIGLIAWLMPYVGLGISGVALLLGILGMLAPKKGAAIAGLLLGVIGLVAAGGHYYYGTTKNYTGSGYFYDQLMNKENAPAVPDTTPGTPIPQPSATTSMIPVTLDTSYYTSKVFGYKIIPPKGWQETEDSGYLIIKNSQPDTNATNSFLANINVVSEDAKSAALATYVAASKTALTTSLADYVLIDDSDVNAGTVAGHLLGGTFTQGENKLRNLQLIMVVENKAYVVTATTLEGAWSGYADVLRQSILTFQIK